MVERSVDQGSMEGGFVAENVEEDELGDLEMGEEDEGEREDERECDLSEDFWRCENEFEGFFENAINTKELKLVFYYHVHHRNSQFTDHRSQIKILTLDSLFFFSCSTLICISNYEHFSCSREGPIINMCVGLMRK